MKRLPVEYFEAIYARDADPWGFESRWYETRKYGLTLTALPRERYARGFEPGCAMGVLTEQLAKRCDALVAAEAVATVAERARQRVRAWPGVEVRELAIPDAWPEGTFDLIVLSEVLYYLRPEAMTDLLARIDASLAPGGHVVAVHWTGETDYPQTGEAVHARLEGHGWDSLARYSERSFALAVFERRAT
jgi:SAM-dependent methyltransferase